MKKCLSVLLATFLVLTCIPMGVSALCGIDGHDVIAPTCTEDGCCRQCGIVYAALGHQYDDSGICMACGEKMENIDVPSVPVEPSVPDEPVEPDVPDDPEECRHEFVDGVRVDPTCSEDGLWEYYCIICYNRYVETLPATGEHRYVSDCAAECEDCGSTREPLATHTYSNPCDSYCDRCNYWRGWLSHVYDNACDTTCNNCDYERQVRGHDYDYACDAVCNECGFTRVPGDHEYDLNCDNYCNYCGHERQGYDHVYDDSRDAVCNVCGVARETTTGSDVIYMQPSDVMTETPGIYLTLYIEASGDYEHVWYLCPPNGTAIEMATGWRMDMVLTEDLNNSTAYCLLTHRVTGATVRSRTVTLHIHVFNNDCDATCNQCRYQRETPGHSYDAICDPDCNRCGAVRSVEHSYGPCSTECYYCGIAVIPTHQFSALCDETCDGCGADRQAAAAHTYEYPCSEYCSLCWTERDASGLHTYDNPCDWQCNVCYAERDAEPHWYDNDCDPDCNACGEERPVHGHWYYDDCDPDCNECGAVRETPGHQYDDDADAYCNLCGAWRNTDPDLPDVSWCDHRNCVGATCVGAGLCADCGTVFPARGHQYDDEFDQECNDCYAWRELDCDHEAGEPWCYGGNVNGLHMVVYDCIHCYQTLRTEAERCYGGTATCWDPAQCERCYLNYGDADGDHVYDDESDLECNVCGQWREVEPDVPVVPDVPCDHARWREPTCFSEGYCPDCGMTFAPVDHVWADGGFCIYCGEKQEIEPDLPDVPVDPDVPCEHINRREPTCTEDGYCFDCGVVFASLDHSWSDATCTVPKTCTACGATEGETLDHDYVARVTKQPTCASDGTKVYTCSSCGDSYTESIAALDHTWSAATCTAPKTCSACGSTEGEELGHDYEKKITKATTTKDGKSENICTVCGYVASKVTTIYKASKISLSKTSYTYNGKVQKPSVTVKDSKGKMVSSSYYTVTYASGRKNAGTYKVTVKFKGNYSGTKTLTFKINPISVSKCDISLSATTYTYNGSTKKPSVTVKNANGTKLTTSSYTVTYASGRKNVGTYKVTIKMKGNYSGTKTLTFKIIPPKTTIKSLTAGKKSLKVAITKKSTQVTGYQIQYSTKKSFSSYSTKTVSSYKTTTVTLSSLSAKKTYYVRVRTYKTVNGKKYYSGWSTIKYKKTK